MPDFVRGFAKLAASAPDLIGQPLHDENFPLTDYAIQRTSTGILVWGRDAHIFQHRDGRLFLWDEGRNQLTGTGSILPEPAPEVRTGPWEHWSAETISAATQCPVERIRQYWPTIYEALAAHEISGKLEQIAAIATTAIETASTFEPVREAYWLSEEWRRVNLTYWPYYGRGFIQLTHKTNYEKYGAALGWPLVNNPDEALDPFKSAMILARYFVDRGVADAAAAQDWLEVRRRVLGSTDAANSGARLQRIAASLLASVFVFPVVGYSGPVDLHHLVHPGAADLFAAEGTDVVTFQAGRVINAGWDDSGGWNVFIQGALQGYYAHGDRRPTLQPGDMVQAGTYLFGVGNTGNASTTKPHLHVGGGPRILNGTGPAGGAGAHLDGSPFDFRSLLLEALGQQTGANFQVFDVGALGLNVRESPGGTKIGVLPEGSLVQGAEHAWREITTDSLKGFVADTFLRPV